MGVETRVYGPPGTGKTSYLAGIPGKKRGQIASAVMKYGPEDVMVSSFTRGASANIRDRVRECGLPISDGLVGTLHAICLRQLGHPKLTEDPEARREWNKENPALALSGGSKSSDPDEYQTASKGDGVSQTVQTLRARMVPEDLWPTNVLAFWNRWKEWKVANGLMDFTDLIEACLTEDVPPPVKGVGFFDEAQDFSRLEMALVRKWGQEMDHTVLVGDEDQCQPEGSKVLVTGGDWVNIEDLDHNIHRLPGYRRANSNVVGFSRTGFSFKKTSRSYSGDILTITTETGKSMKCTPDHICIARWSDEAFNPDKTIVYLMKKDNKFRIGWCQLMRSDRALHIGTRARLEKAEALWALRVCDTKKDASMWKKGKGSTSGAQIFTNTAENLLPELMSIPVATPGKKTISWEKVKTITREQRTCRVYSLEVDDVHNYITNDGIITHNCLYSFKGGDPEVMLYPELPPEHLKVLGQSYRVPEAIRSFSEAWIKRVSKRFPKEYRPRIGSDGEIVQGTLRGSRWDFQTSPENIVDEAEKITSEGRSVMFLASCSFMLNPLLTVLRERGIPFHNPYVTGRGDWNPLNSGGVSSAQRLLALLRPDEATWGPDRRRWTKEDIESFGKIMSSQGVFWRGVKAKIDRGELDTSDLAEIFVDDACSTLVWGEPDEWVSWWEEHLLAARRRGASFPCYIYRKRGGAALREKPMITVGTIHSVKGGESDVVYVSPDLSPQAAQAWARSGDRDAVDAILRQFYVAFTRAREELVLCNPSGNSSISWRWKA